MRKKRELTEEVFYHVTSRTNNKIRVFENKLGRKIMLMTLQDAKYKYRFRLANFCVMPTHIYLLMKPCEGVSLNKIMQWIKTRAAKRWNCIHGSIDHLWGDRYFAKPVGDRQKYDFIMNYIDQNPVTAGLATNPEDWKASGAYYKMRNIPGLIDIDPENCRCHIKMLPLIPFFVSRLIPPAQLERTLKYFGAYAEAIGRFNSLIPTIPLLGETAGMKNPPASLHYTTKTANYFIYEYDRKDTLYGKICSYVYPAVTKYQQFSLSSLKKNQFLELDFSWCQSPEFASTVNCNGTPLVGGDK